MFQQITFLETVGSKAIFFIIVLFILTSPAYQLLARQTVTWYQPSAPPCYITEGEYQNTGLCDKIQSTITGALSEYHHQTQISNYPRMFRHMREDANICGSIMLKQPERDSYLVYSIPVLVAPSVMMVVHVKHLTWLKPYIINSQEIDIRKILREKDDIRIGIMIERFTGTDIDSIISPYRGTGKIIERLAPDSTGLATMLAASRLDMAFMQPTEFIYSVRQHELKQNDFKFFNIFGAKNYNVFHVACSKKGAGPELIKHVNEIITVNQDRFIEFQKEWMNQSLKETYQKILNEVLPTLFPAKY